MIWSRLKSMKCPDCNAVIIKGEEFYHCSVCKFKVRHERFNTLVADLYKPKNYEIEGDNAYELNNLDLRKRDEQ